MVDKTIVEKLEHMVKTSKINESYFKSKCNKRASNTLRDDLFYTPDFHRGYLEDEFNYCLFSLYCFFDYSIEDVFNLVTSLGSKYHKSGLHMLVYSDFVDYFEVNMFDERKESYLKSSDEYREKMKIKEEVESESILSLSRDYYDTLVVIDSLNQDITDICNNEDLSPEKRLELIDKYSKVSIRLNEKRFDLLGKIKVEKL